MDDADNNYYDVLEINPSASLRDILRSYQRLRIVYGANSPVTYTGIEDEERKVMLAKIEEAYLVLSISSKRREYDKLHKIEKCSTENTVKEEIKHNTKGSFEVKTPKFKLDPAFEEEIKNQTIFDGAFLKRVREYKNIKLEDISTCTKISKNYFKLIEEEEASKFPAPIFLKNYLAQYATYLKLDPTYVCQSYLDRLKEK
jgi:curved DNA-binding protein CbpA